jgi:LPLT family lysophospholipid transporter-like MFS transporter
VAPPGAIASAAQDKSPQSPPLALQRFWTAPSFGLIASQALAAFADTALLLVAIMAARSQAGGDAVAGQLQQMYVLPFLLLAPLAGAIVNGCPKRRIMLIAGVLKFGAAAALALGASPMAVMICVGVGAAVYSPAKYGILMEVFGERRLVMANAAMEGTSIVMLVTGTVASGILADGPPALALGVILAAYASSALLLMRVPAGAAERRIDWRDLPGLLRRFRQATLTLFGHGEARFSLLGTSLLLASATTLRLLILAWVPAVLGIGGGATPALLMGVSAVGMVAGAVAAGRMAGLSRPNAVLVPGALMGLLIVALARVANLEAAFIVAFAIGACAGSFVVPLNAALQRTGAATVGTGYALAVQNFSENLATIAMVGAYALVADYALGVRDMLSGFGVSVVAMMLLTLWLRRSKPVPASAERI